MSWDEMSWDGIRKGKPRDIKSYYGLPKRVDYDDLMAGDCAVRSRICSAS